MRRRAASACCFRRSRDSLGRMDDRRTLADRIRAFVFRPWRTWAAGAVAKDPGERTAMEQGWAEADRASRDSRLFDLFEGLLLVGLPAGVGIAASSAGWSVFGQVAVIVLAGFVGWLLAPTLWALSAAMRAPVQQRNQARAEVVRLRHDVAEARAETERRVEEAQRRSAIKNLKLRLSLAKAVQGRSVEEAIEIVPDGDLTGIEPTRRTTQEPSCRTGSAP
jgi:hypothetical protein